MPPSDDARTAMEVWLDEDCAHGPLVDPRRGSFGEIADPMDRPKGWVCFDCLADLFARLAALEVENAKLRSRSLYPRDAIDVG